MKVLFLLAFLFCFSSCNYFDKKKVYSEDLLEEELKTFNWNEVDEYPIFKSCDQNASKHVKKLCFESTLRNHLNTNLSQYNIVVTENVSDTIMLKLFIDKTGELSITDINCKATTRSQIVDIDSMLVEGLKGLPIIYPAIKRSQHVATLFQLPVYLQIQ